jgi:hypothetical protein
MYSLMRRKQPKKKIDLDKIEHVYDEEDDGDARART